MKEKVSWIKIKMKKRVTNANEFENAENFSKVLRWKNQFVG